MPKKALRRGPRLGPWPQGCALAALLVLASCAGVPPPLPPAPAHANGQALWRLINERCIPGQRLLGDPAPCAVVSLGPDKAYAVLKDQNGVAQYLVMPTAKITGIEDPKLLAPDIPNYFAEAWTARSFVKAKLGGAVSDDWLSVAVNSMYGRTQDQLHLHIDCLDSEVRKRLQEVADQTGTAWSQRPVVLAGQPYLIRRLEALEAVSPFALLATLPAARAGMGAWTLVLAGGETAAGEPRFYLLAGRADPKTGDKASGEQLQDHQCQGVSPRAPSQ